MTQHAKQLCAYHPATAAQWTCPACDLDFCPACIRQVARGSVYGETKLKLCPKCSEEVTWLGVGNLLEPFWNRLPKIFLYPLSFQPLLLIAGFALLQALIDNAGVLGLYLWFPKLILWGIFVKYSYEALIATARGSLKPPEVSVESMTEGLVVVFKQGMLYLALGLFFFLVVYYIGPGFSLIYLALALLFLPSMIILLAATDSVLHALNPLLFVSMVFRIGWSYLLMYLFLVLLLAAPGMAGHYLIRFMPEFLKSAMITFAEGFYMLVSYHLMGYVLLQFHKEIGYEIEYEEFVDPTARGAAAAPAEDDEARLLREIEPMVKEGNLEAALAAIQKATLGRGIQGLPLSERYYNLLKTMKRSADLAAYAPQHLNHLVAANQKTKALEVYLACLELNRDFVPEAPALMKLAAMFGEAGRGKEAVAAYSRFTKSYPTHPSAPVAYFRAAQVFHDRLMDPARSKQILQALIKKYPGHDIIPQVQNYLASI